MQQPVKAFLVEGPLGKGPFVFFWRIADPNGFLCNWFPAPFEAGGVRFVHSEQYMMYHKALLMGDEKTGQKILAESDPKVVKKLGQAVTPWHEERWTEARCRIMYEACHAKFAADEKLREELLATGSKVLVEASPLDRIWGIGLAANDPDARVESKWKGLNLLGRVLMQVREDLRVQVRE